MSRQFVQATRTIASAAATANLAMAQLWNPGTRSIWLKKLEWTKTVATADFPALLRTSARGTAASNTAAVQSNSTDYQGVPFSTAAVDLGTFSAQPTYVSATAYLARWTLAAAIGGSFTWVIPGDGIEIPTGMGLAVVSSTATVLQPADCIFTWTE